MFAIYARVGTNMRIGIACVVVLTVAALTGFQEFAFVYLFGWPVLALLSRVVTSGSGWELFTYSLPVTIALAGISWWVVERPCLRAIPEHEDVDLGPGCLKYSISSEGVRAAL
jgi:hypothetical protein